MPEFLNLSQSSTATANPAPAPAPASAPAPAPASAPAPAPASAPAPATIGDINGTQEGASTPKSKKGKSIKYDFVDGAKVSEVIKKADAEGFYGIDSGQVTIDAVLVNNKSISAVADGRGNTVRRPKIVGYIVTNHGVEDLEVWDDVMFDYKHSYLSDLDIDKIQKVPFKVGETRSLTPYALLELAGNVRFASVFGLGDAYYEEYKRKSGLSDISNVILTCQLNLKTSKTTRPDMLTGTAVSPMTRVVTLDEDGNVITHNNFEGNKDSVSTIRPAMTSVRVDLFDKVNSEGELLEGAQVKEEYRYGFGRIVQPKKGKGVNSANDKNPSTRVAIAFASAIESKLQAQANSEAGSAE